MAEAVQDATIMEEIQVEEDVMVDLEAKEVVLHQEEMAEEMAVSEVIEIHREKKVVLEAKEADLHQEEKALQDVLKVLEIHQDQEDQEEVNFFS